MALRGIEHEVYSLLDRSSIQLSCGADIATFDILLFTIIKNIVI